MIIKSNVSFDSIIFGCIPTRNYVGVSWDINNLRSISIFPFDLVVFSCIPTRNYVGMSWDINDLRSISFFPITKDNCTQIIVKMIWTSTIHKSQKISLLCFYSIQTFFFHMKKTIFNTTIFMIQCIDILFWFDYDCDF